MTSPTEQYRAAASQARTAIQKSADFWTQSTQTLSDQTGFPGVPRLDLRDGVQAYFDVVQRLLESSRDLALTWADAASSLCSVAREQTDNAELADTAGPARRPYRDLPTAKLSAILVERELPVTGEHDELVERLVEADTNG